MSRGVLSLHVGQAGVQIGNAVWELFCLEHGILPNGKGAGDDSGRNQTIFYESNKGYNVPRAVFADLEPTCIDEIRTGAYRHLFSKDSLVTGKEDAASNYARGYYSLGNEFSELVMERLRRQAERCEHLDGVLIFRSFGGGTGSGLGANLIGKIARDYGKGKAMELSVYPSPRVSPVVVEPYNTVLTTHATMETSTYNVLFDNEAIYDICENRLDVRTPTYTNLNRLIAQVVSGGTCGLRSSSRTTPTLLESLPLVPFPSLHFPLASFAPLVADSRLPHELITPASLVAEAFRPQSQMVKVDPQLGQYISCVAHFRGDVSPGDANAAIERAKTWKNVHFVDYSAGGFTVGHCGEMMSYVTGSDLGVSPASLTMLANSTAIRTAWERIGTKFDTMYKRRAFVHHFVGEGMEEAEFNEAREDLKQLIEAYSSAESGTGRTSGRSRGPSSLRE